MTIFWLAIAFFAGSFLGVLVVAFGRAAGGPTPRPAEPMDTRPADANLDGRFVA